MRLCRVAGIGVKLTHALFVSYHLLLLLPLLLSCLLHICVRSYREVTEQQERGSGGWAAFKIGTSADSFQSAVWEEAPDRLSTRAPCCSCWSYEMLWVYGLQHSQ